MNKLILAFVLLTISTFLYGQDINLDPSDPKSGYININELTFGYGLGSRDIPYSKYFYGLTTLHGYEFNINPFYINSSLSLSAGTGMLFFDEGAMFPLIADLRYTINLSKISPFVFSNGALLLNLDNLRDQSMICVNGGAGARLRLTNKLNLSVGTGLFMQFGRESRRDTFANLRIGVTFKPGPRQKMKGSLVLAQSSELCCIRPH